MAEIFGLFGVTDYDVARRMTLREYVLRYKGYLLAFLDSEYFAYLNAFASLQVQSTDNKGHLRYSRFIDFYDKEQRHKEVFGCQVSQVKHQRLLQIARNLRAYHEKKGDENGDELFG